MVSAEQKIAEIVLREEENERIALTTEPRSQKTKKNASFRLTATLDQLTRSELNLYENDRPALTEKDLQEKYNFDKFKSDNALNSSIRYVTKRYKPSGNCLLNFFLDRFPILRWIRAYNLKESALKDLIAGVTIGIVHIPQGMAYSLVAGLPAIYGLYVSLFPVFIYAIMGTSRHLSMGTFAITSIMTFSAISKLEGKYYASNCETDVCSDAKNSSELFNYITSTPPLKSNSYLSEDPTEAKIKISMALTLLVGIIQACFAIFHIGFVTKYLSDVIVAGFTTGAAFHIIISQVNPFFGISTGKVTTSFKLIGNIIEICKNLYSINLATVLVGLTALVIFILVKELINERYKHRMIMPVPIELMLVVFGTALAYLFNFNQRWNVKVVGDLPRGLPIPSLPPVHLFPAIFSDAMSIAIVSYALNISMAKLFAKKHKYELNTNQEAFAYSIGNILTSFFKGFPSCVALSRMAILESVDAKTQMFGLISSALVLVVCLVIGPLFKTLPNTVLAALIIYALKNMILQIRKFPEILEQSKFEALAWAATFGGVMVFDVDIGLYIGVVFTLLLVIFRSQRPNISVLGNIQFTDIYEDTNICQEAEEIPGIKILRFEESVFYANVDTFKYKVIKHSDINLNDVLARQNREKSQINKLAQERNEIRKRLHRIIIAETVMNQGFDNKAFAIEEEIDRNMKLLSDEVKLRLNKINEDLETKHIILDCSCINNIDSQGVLAFLQLFETFREVGVRLHLTYCKSCVKRMFNKTNFDEKFNYEYIYPTTHDAILHICHRTNAKAAAVASKTSPIYQKRFLPSQRHSQFIEQPHVPEAVDEKKDESSSDDVDSLDATASSPPLAKLDIEFVDETKTNTA